jgi:methylglutaconyl-CoA hydratase
MASIVIERGSRGECHLIIDNPSRRNALTLSMIEALEKQFAGLALDDACRIIVLRGAGDHFCSGRDLSDLKDVAALSEEGARADYDILRRLMQLVYEFPKPSVALVRGHAIGLGVALASLCDVVVATADAQFSFPEVRFGVAPTLSTAMLLRNVAPKKALYALLTGSKFDGAEAERIGLVSRAVAADDFDESANALITDMLAASPEACAHLKDLIRSVDGAAFPQALDAAMDGAAKAVRSEDAAEARRARQEKRPPSWVLP